jgi:hypothetical protein
MAKLTQSILCGLIFDALSATAMIPLPKECA